MNLHEALLYKNILGTSGGGGGGLPSGHNGDVLTYVSGGNIKVSFKESYTDEELAEFVAFQEAHREEQDRILTKYNDRIDQGDYSFLPLIQTYAGEGSDEDGYNYYNYLEVDTVSLGDDGNLIYGGYFNGPADIMQSFFGVTGWVDAMTLQKAQTPLVLESANSDIATEMFAAFCTEEMADVQYPTGKPKWEARETVVKSVMCDNITVWTEDEQAAAREKLGLINVAEVGA